MISLSFPLSAQENGENPEQKEPEIQKKADALPKSILFPRGQPGPYIPPAPIALPGPAINAEAKPEILTVPDRVTVETEKPEVEMLELIDIIPAAMGLLNADQGGFSADLWQGSGLSHIEQMLARLPGPTKSPVMTRLTRQLLLSAAPPPEQAPKQGPKQGPEQGETDEETYRHFLSLRIEKIGESGDLKDLSAFLNLLPPSSYLGDSYMGDKDIHWRKISDLMLLAGDVSSACQLGRRALENEQSDQYWLKLLAYCHAVQGNGEQAALTVEMLMEQGNMNFIFFDLINKISQSRDGGQLADSQGESLSSGLDQLDAITYSMLSFLEQPIDGTLFAEAGPLILYALSGNANVQKTDRLMAAGQSFALATYPADKMRIQYGNIDFSADELENAIAIAGEDDTIVGDALLFQSAAKQIEHSRKAEILNTIWTRALESRDLPRAAQINARTLRALGPTEELLFHAHHITRALLLSGQMTQAATWFDFIRNAAYDGQAEATRALISIWPLMIISGHDDQLPWTKDILDLWWNGQMVLSPDARQEKAALFFATAEALGFTVPPDMWQELNVAASSDGRHAIPVAVWRNLIKSVKENKRGEVLLLIRLAGGEAGLSNLDPVGVSVMIRALRSIGLEADAHALALEIMANNGF